MDRIRIGMIGCGGIANGKHMPALKSQRDAEMVAFCDLEKEKAEKAAKEFGTEKAAVETDYRRLLEDKTIDAVHVCTPNRSHAEITVAALAAGKHVMCEKPMAVSYAEAKGMADAAKKYGKLLTVGYQNRYRPDSLYLKAECEKGELGEIYYARARALRRRAVPTWGVFLNEKEQGGGSLIDIGTHALDLTLFMMDNYRPKFAVGSVYHKLNKDRESANIWGDWKPEEFTVEDSAFGFVVMENGATVSVESSWALNVLTVGEAQTLLAGTKGGADMFDGLRINGVRHNRAYTTKPAFEDGAVDYFGGNSVRPEMLEARTFLNAVKGEGKLLVLPEQAAVVTRILEGIYRSAESGSPFYF